MDHQLAELPNRCMAWHPRAHTHGMNPLGNGFHGWERERRQVERERESGGGELLLHAKLRDGSFGKTLLQRATYIFNIPGNWASTLPVVRLCWEDCQSELLHSREWTLDMHMVIYTRFQFI
jgi:hypothetical protein